MAYTDNDYAPINLISEAFFETDFNTDNGLLGPAGSGFRPKFGISGGNYRQGFNPNDFPTKLDPMAGPSYGLPSIWQGDMTTAETNAWANSMKTNKDIPQFMQNTFTDPMAERMGKGVYNMDFNNPKNRPAEQLTPAYQQAKTIFNTPANVARMKQGVNPRKSYQSLNAIANAPKASKGFTRQSAQYANFGRGR